MSPEQKRQMEEAKREAIEKTYNVCADGEKHSSNQYKYDSFGNEINNE